jgi:hypothetical protein
MRQTDDHPNLSSGIADIVTGDIRCPQPILRFLRASAVLALSSATADRTLELSDDVSSTR